MRYLLPAEQLAPSKYQRDQNALARFERFCISHGRIPYPASVVTLRLFLSGIYGRISADTLKEYVNAITRWHVDHGLRDPFASRMMQALLRVSRRHCLTNETALPHLRALKDVLDRISLTPQGDRDRAMLLLNVCGRISGRAMCELNRNDVTFAWQGMRVRARYGHAIRNIAIASYEDPLYDPVAAMERYTRHIYDDEPALFRCFSSYGITGRRLNRGGAFSALRQWLSAPGQQKITLVELRARAVITASNRHAGEYDIMRQFGYSRPTPVRRWVRRIGRRVANIGEKLRL